MNTRCLVVAAWVVLALGSGARGQFTPGHVFVAEPSGKNCNNPDVFGSDRIWEIDPETGEVTLFRTLTAEECGSIRGLTFTPGGSRLRASLALTDQIVEFDSDGNMTVALDAADGLSQPAGSNGIAYDADGNFYVSGYSMLLGLHILRFPYHGGPATVFADENDGISTGGAIAFTTDDDLYSGGPSPPCTILRITPEGNASVFDNLCVWTLTADQTGHLYAGQFSGEIFRYEAGDPGSQQLLVDSGVLGWHVMTMSPDQTRIYAVGGSSFPRSLFAIDPVDGTVTPLTEIPELISWGGVAVAPYIPPIPAMSEWALVVLALLLLVCGKIMLRRTRLHSRTVSNSTNICSAVKLRVHLDAPFACYGHRLKEGAQTCTRCHVTKNPIGALESRRLSGMLLVSVRGCCAVSPPWGIRGDQSPGRGLRRSGRRCRSRFYAERSLGLRSDIPRCVGPFQLALSGGRR